MNYIVIILTIILASTSGCLTSKPPRLDKAEASRIGMNYAQDRRWDVKHVWEGITFNDSTREWQMLFDVRPYGGPFIVCVNDKTKGVRFERGE
jgi:hypothetical protein